MWVLIHEIKQRRVIVQIDSRQRTARAVAYRQLHPGVFLRRAVIPGNRQPQTLFNQRSQGSVSSPCCIFRFDKE